ncbi:OsmC family peroxiredoxin [Paraburkholderia sp. UYCP14C]|uniref:OsmC family protein n=1 Tax=Paraburkholderia sp. UYCP14C TaxID=2511130 RepID=UPI0010213398|nr:OsmC family protein [Paraburkholderia sp. UYCP14C]RZF24216.1 OsmC family peroxiredoxin [Paraburkholderia sp. UYCP14C]
MSKPELSKRRVSIENGNPSSDLGRLIAQQRAEASSLNAQECVDTFSGSTCLVEGLRSEGRFSDLVVTIDEPVKWGGTGRAPNPAEVMLAALGASIEITVKCYAEYLGIQVKSIGVELSAEMDSRGFYGVSPESRSGFSGVSAKVKIASDEPPEVISQLLEIAERCCPVLDNVRRPTEVVLSLDRVQPGEH